MSELKITIDQLKNYLGTGLRFHYMGEIDEETDLPIDHELISVSQNGWVDAMGKLKTIEDQYHIDEMFPLCYRLSDLNKFIPELGFVPIEELLRISYPKWFEEKKGTRYEEIEVDQTPNYTKSWVKYMATFCVDIWMVDIENEKWCIIQQLFQWHFWPFGDEYFEAGLVIDKLSHNTPTH